MEVSIAGLIFTTTSADKIASMDLVGHPFLHEQGQVVLRGVVKLFDISEQKWCMSAHKIEVLQKYAGVWAAEDQVETYHGPTDQTSFYCCDVKGHPKFGVSTNFSCYGSKFHIGMPADDPWRGNIWPELDTEYLTPDMTSSGLSQGLSIGHIFRTGNIS